MRQAKIFSFCLFFSFASLCSDSSSESQTDAILQYLICEEGIPPQIFGASVDLSRDSVASIKNDLVKRVRQIRALRVSLDPYLVLVGYGENNSKEKFFASSDDIDNDTPLSIALPQIPPRNDRSRWYFYFVDQNYSSSALCSAKLKELEGAVRAKGLPKIKKAAPMEIVGVKRKLHIEGLPTSKL